MRFKDGRLATPSRTKTEMLIDMKKFSRFLIFYTLLVILWGAWVRISNSGDGCGKSWPLCQNSIIPKIHTLPSWIELSHRLTSGIFGLSVLLLVYLAYKKYPKQHPIRRSATMAGILTISEALLGARLVLAGLVTTNDSIARAYTMSLHLINSLALFASLVLTYYFSETNGPGIKITKNFVTISQRNFTWKDRTLNFLFLVLFILIVCTGSIAALSTTLFPSESLISGLMADFQKNSHYLVRLRIYHPILAILGSGLLIFILWIWRQRDAQNTLFQTWNSRLISLVFFNVALGATTLFSLSPIVLRLGHLTMAYAIWSAFILMWAHLYRPSTNTNLIKSPLSTQEK